MRKTDTSHRCGIRLAAMMLTGTFSYYLSVCAVFSCSFVWNWTVMTNVPGGSEQPSVNWISMCWLPIIFTTIHFSLWRLFLGLDSWIERRGSVAIYSILFRVIYFYSLTWIFTVASRFLCLMLKKNTHCFYLFFFFFFRRTSWVPWGNDFSNDFEHVECV